MKARLITWITMLTIIAVLALPSQAIGQRARAASYPYILVVVGTLGGPQSDLGNGFQISRRGAAGGEADTPTLDPYAGNPNPFLENYPTTNPYIQHGVLWQNGTLTDLGALPGTNSSNVTWVNRRGDAVGQSGNGAIDPITGWPEMRAILWSEGHLINLGTLLGGYESAAGGANDQDQVGGISANGTPDPFSMAGWGTQTRTFLWQHGQMRDLGTLGGPDSFGGGPNERGQVSGWSYTNAISNATTGIPTQDPFLWTGGHMQDLGTLGGTLGLAFDLNNQGEVVGQSNLAGDQTYHPFLWDGHTLHDLGTLGGNYGAATWINDTGAAVGWTTTVSDTASHAVLWQHGTMTDLGVPSGETDSAANDINALGKVVGNTATCGPSGCTNGAFLWQHGQMFDLQTLVAPTELQLTEAGYISDRGEISAVGLLPNGDERGALLIPADLAASEGITSNAPAPSMIGSVRTTRLSLTPCTLVPPLYRRLALRYQPPVC
jgi:probable HAF family extracellular repeat protein